MLDERQAASADTEIVRTLPAHNIKNSSTEEIFAMDFSTARKINRLFRLVALARKHNEARKKRGDQRGMMRAAELEMTAEAKIATMLGVMSFNEFD